MSHIQWEDQYSVNVAAIDEQHRKLFDVLNALFDANTASQDGKALAKAVADMVDYARYHFTTEEIFLKTYDFPGLAAHQKEHEAFRAKVAEFHEDFLKGKKTLTLEMENFLINWLLNHILKTDKQYAPFLNGKGIY